MNQALFAARNVADKAKKALAARAVLRFYLNTYVLARFEKVPCDSLVVSYPKCGKTWLRMLMHSYLGELGVPERRFRDRNIVALPEGRALRFEHHQGTWVPAPPRRERLRLEVANYAGKRVVFLVRDPRDVLVSSWYHLRYREHIYRRPLSQFVRDDLVGIHKVVDFFNLWLDGADRLERFLVLSYEDLHADTARQFRRLLEFLDLPVDDEPLARAVESCSFEALKRLEAERGLDEPWMRPGAEDAKAMKIRRGRPQAFREELTADDLEFVNAVMRAELTSRLPYAAV